MRKSRNGKECEKREIECRNCFYCENAWSDTYVCFSPRFSATETVIKDGEETEFYCRCKKEELKMRKGEKA